MFDELTTWTRLLAATTSSLLHTTRTTARRRYSSGDRPVDAGYTTEAVIVTALFAAGAIAVAAIIVAKIMARANSITL
jgi:hypothetical protein